MTKAHIGIAAAAAVLAAGVASAVFETTGSSPPQGVVVQKLATTGFECRVSNRQDWANGYDQPGGAGGNCLYRTLVTITNRAFICNRALSSYGPLPVKVVAVADGPWTGPAAATFILSNGCTGDGDNDTIDLIVDSSTYTGGVLDQWGPGNDAAKYNGSTGPHDLQWTGEFQCGVVHGHQDGLQMQASSGHVALVNGKTGDWAAGTSTCIGAGGAVFYSSANGHFPAPGTDVLGGEFVICNHGLYGGNTPPVGGYPDQHTGTVADAGFRAGRKDGSDQNCGAVGTGSPCLGGNTLTMVNLDCEVWNKVTKAWARR